MARGLPSNIVTQINGSNIRLAYLVKIETATNILLTDHAKNVTFDSQTYVADGSLSITDQIQENSDLEYSDISMQLYNTTNSIKNIFLTDNYVNKNAVIFCAFLDPSETIINAFEYFKGTVASASVSDTTNGIIVDVQLANQFKNWDIVRGRKFTDQSQQDIYTGDRGMQFAHLAKNDIRWRA